MLCLDHDSLQGQNGKIFAVTQVEIKNELLPSLKVFAKVIEEWKEDGIGDVFQVCDYKAPL